MIGKCANPACSTPFRYLHEGRLFRFERGVSEKGQPFLSFDATRQERSNRVELFLAVRSVFRQDDAHLPQGSRSDTFPGSERTQSGFMK